MTNWYEVSPADLNTESQRVDSIQFLSRVRRFKEADGKLAKKPQKVLASDLYNLFYKAQPELKDTEELPDPALAEWMSQFMDTEEYQEIRQGTVRNVSSSMIASVKFMEEYQRRRESELKDLISLKEKRVAAASMMSQLPDMVIQTLEKFDEINGSWAERFHGEGVGEEELRLMEKGIEAAAETLDMVNALAELDKLAGGNGLMSDERKIELAFDSRIMGRVKDQDAFRKIIALMGRLKFISKGLKSKKVRERTVPMGLAVGNDLNRVVPSELMMLDDEDTEELFWKKFTDKTLVQYDVRDKDEEGFGPIIVLLDKSYSMAGKRQHIAAGFTAEMMRVALESKRRCWVVQFDDTVNHVDELRKSDDLIRFIATALRAGNGTDFAPAYKKGIEITRKQEKERTDIVLVTDGMSKLYPEMINEMKDSKKELGIRYFGIQVAKGNSWQKELEWLFDAQVVVNYRSDKSIDEGMEVILDKVVR